MIPQVGIKRDLKWFMRFVAKRSNGCWEWVGRKREDGYGQFAVRRQAGKVLRVNVRTHRYSWFLHCGEIPKGKMVLHRCDNPPCVNPAHLFLGTDLDNKKDCDTKGRANGGSLPGSDNPNAALNERIVQQMRKLKSEGLRVKQLASNFGVSVGCVCKVVYRQSWKHVQ